MKLSKSWMSRLALLLALLGSCTVSIQAQETGSSMNGTIRDATGAAVNHATIVATNLETNARSSAQTENGGEYTLLDLRPGSYKLSVTAPGFRTYIQTGILLNLNQHAQVDITLQVGEVEQKVEVNADVTGLDTTTSSLSSEVDNVSINSLPLNTRESYSLLELVPGYSGSIGNNYNDVEYSINGGNNEYGDILVDGTPAGFPTVNGYQGVGVFPSVDAIGEFRLYAQNMPAEFGRTLDGILNVVFKSGSNQYHGSAFEFMRNSALDSNDFFSNQNGSPLPLFHRNQFGGVFDGPILHDRTFFLVSAEILKANNFQSTTKTVPTDAQRQGDFSSTYAADGSLITIYNPFTTTLDPSTGDYYRTAFPGNKITTNLSTVAQNILKYYPEPTSSGDPLTHANNYFANGSTVDETIAWDIRVDHNLSDKQKIFARYSNRYYDDDPNPLFPQAQEVAEGRIDQNDTSRDVALGYTVTLTPHTILDTRLGFARTLFEYQNTSYGFQDSTLGLPASINAASGSSPLFPQISTSGYVTLGNNGHRHNAFMTYSALGSVTMERGKHILKAGFDGRMIRVNDHEVSYGAGGFTFGTGWTQGPDPNSASADTGNGFASLLLGTGTGYMIQDYKNVATQSFYYAEYLQDDWKIIPKLTLNLGVRYDLETPRTERFNRMNYFDPNVASPLSAELSGLTGGLVFVGVNGNGRHQYNINWNNVSPRIGFAYSATPSTVVHGGFGIVYGASNQAAAGTVGPYGWRVQNTWVSSLDGITPYNTLDNPFPSGFSNPPGAAAGLLTGVGGQIEGVLQHDPTPYMIQWSLDIQQSLPYNITADIAYVGNRGRQQIQSYEGGMDYDQLPVADLSLGSTLENSVSNPFYGAITTGTLAAATTTKAQLLLHYPQYTSMQPLRVAGGNSQYDGLQLSVSRRLINGLQLQGSYVWSRNFDNNSNHQDTFHPMADYAISYQDIRNRFVVSYLYQLPFGHGHRYGAAWKTWENTALGGWQLNGITTMQGGMPLQISANNDLSNWNFQNLYADTNFQDASYSGAVKNRLNKYFNTADFSQPAAFKLGNGPAYYDNLRTPGLDSTDFSIFKEFKPTEKLSAQFRAEAFNVFNHPEFDYPDTTVTDTDFGVITDQANSPRQIQFGLKFLF